jgi:hypothetical protein
MIKRMIDPPGGWRYGFPKEIPADRLEDVNAWLLEQGYPKWLIDPDCRYRSWLERDSDPDT